MKLETKFLMDEIDKVDVVKYLEETAFDSNGRIFHSDHEKFLVKSSFFNLNSQTVKMTW